MKILNHQYKAVKIYKNIQQTKKDFFDLLEKQGLIKNLEQKYHNILIKNKLDQKTAEILKQLLANSKGTTEDEKIKQITETAVSDFILKLGTDRKQKEKQIVITLSEDGDLRKESLRYPMRKEAKRLKLFKVLTNRYIKTELLCEKSGAKNNQAVRKTIGVINQKAKNRLKLKQPLVESKSGCGYQINNLYKLIKK